MQALVRGGPALASRPLYPHAHALLSALCLALAVAGCGNGTTIDGRASNASGGSIPAAAAAAPAPTTATASGTAGSTGSKTESPASGTTPPGAPKKPSGGGEWLVGVGTHFGQGRGDVPASFALMKSAGLNAYRDEIFWSFVEKQPERPVARKRKLSLVRASLDAAKGNGFAPILILDYGNSLYGGGFPLTDESRKAFAAYAGFMATRFTRKNPPLRSLERMEWRDGPRGRDRRDARARDVLEAAAGDPRGGEGGGSVGGRSRRSDGRERALGRAARGARRHEIHGHPVHPPLYVPRSKGRNAGAPRGLPDARGRHAGGGERRHDSPHIHHRDGVADVRFGVRRFPRNGGRLCRAHPPRRAGDPVRQRDLVVRAAGQRNERERHSAQLRTARQPASHRSPPIARCRSWPR